MWPGGKGSLSTSVGLLFGDVGGVVFVEEKDIDDDEGGTDGDGGVGDVEGGPVVGAKPDLQEVGDRAVDDAVGDVAGGAAEQQREAGSSEGAAAVTSDEQPSERADHRSRPDDQQDAHGGGWRIGEDTEGDTGIAAVHQVDEIVNQLAVPTLDGLQFEPSFAGAVEEDDGEGEPEPAEAGGNQTSSPSCGSMAGSAFDFGECFCTALAHGRVARVLADAGGIVPAALALLALGSKHLDMEGFWVIAMHRAIKRQYFYLRNDQKFGEFL